MQQKSHDKLMYNMREDLTQLRTEEMIDHLDALLKANRTNPICQIMTALYDAAHNLSPEDFDRKRRTGWFFDNLFDAPKRPNPFKKSNRYSWGGSGLTVAGLKSEYAEDAKWTVLPSPRVEFLMTKFDYWTPEPKPLATTQQLYGEIRIILYGLCQRGYETLVHDEKTFMRQLYYERVYEVLETPT